MFNEDTELALQLEEIRRMVMRNDILFGESRTETCPGGCGAVWPKSRVRLARQGCKLDGPLARTVKLCGCDLWVPCKTSEAKYELEVASVRAYCTTLYSRLAERNMKHQAQKHGA